MDGSIGKLNEHASYMQATGLGFDPCCVYRVFFFHFSLHSKNFKAYRMIKNWTVFTPFHFSLHSTNLKAYRMVKNLTVFTLKNCRQYNSKSELKNNKNKP